MLTRDNLFDKAELALALGMSLAEIDRALIERRLPMPTSGNGKPLWHRGEIFEWEAEYASRATMLCGGER